ncbi:hypothetical protein QR680_010099 [Steinernema hermaphroditum]|uniref:Uncharacterized protein n=1 Tax=Steinernema hermaphroditum TaxID=289476 RepID=A0AA39IMQ9_9BILA|nr:hypothetical protein QR680_010099 [Steinernema hermaphroditum]
MFQEVWSPPAVFWMGAAMFASAFTVVVFRYAHQYSRYCQLATGVLMISSFAVIFGCHTLGYKDTTNATKPREPALNFVLSVDIAQLFLTSKTSLCVVNFVLTLLFVREIYVFLKRTQNTEVHKNIKAANQVVVVQVLAEVILVVVPESIVIPTEYLGVRLSAIMGPFIIPMCMTYTLICAVLMTAKLRKRKAAVTVSVVTAKTC